MEENRFTKESVDMYADKLYIRLSEEENKMVLKEFGTIDKSFSVFKDIEGLDEIEPMSWCLDRTIDSLREDEIQQSISVEDLLANSDCTTDCEIEVPKVVTE